MYNNENTLHSKDVEKDTISLDSYVKENTRFIFEGEM